MGIDNFTVEHFPFEKKKNRFCREKKKTRAPLVDTEWTAYIKKDALSENYCHKSNYKVPKPNYRHLNPSSNPIKYQPT